MQNSTRMPLAELRTVAAIHGGRVVIESVARGRETGIYELRGPLVMRLCADSDGAVSRETVKLWKTHAELADEMALEDLRAGKSDAES